MHLITNLLSTEVKKPTPLIHYCRSLSTNGRRLLTLLVHFVRYSKPNDQNLYVIRTDTVRTFLDLKSGKDYNKVYDAFNNLYDSNIEWNFFEEDRTFSRLRCRFLISMILPGDKPGDGLGKKYGRYIAFQLHPELEEIIKNPKVFARLKFIMIALLSDPKYAFDLYELFADSESRGKPDFRIALPEIKNYLNIPESSYPKFKDFQRRVLSPCIQAIEKVSDFSVQYQIYRDPEDKRKTAGINFSVRRKMWQPPLFVEVAQELERLMVLESRESSIIPLQLKKDDLHRGFVDHVVRFGVQEKDALLAVENYGLDGANEILSYALNKKETAQNFSAYLAQCLKKGFGLKTADEKELEEKKVNARKNAKEQADKEERARAENELEIEYNLVVREEAIKIYHSLSAGEKKTIFVKIINEVSPLEKKRIEEIGVDTMTFKIRLPKYLKEHLSPPLHSFDAWKKGTSSGIVKGSLDK